MKVGIPKEIKNNENRVGMTPAGVAAMTARGHEVYVQHTAGDGSGFSDDEYVGEEGPVAVHLFPFCLRKGADGCDAEGR